MKVRELYEALDRRIPRALSCDWDNDGLMCCPDPERTVKKVLIVLDITEQAVEKAVRESFDVILSHHPMIFRGLTCVDPAQAVARKTVTLIRAGITAMSFHTRLDRLPGGVNDVLAQVLGLIDPVPFGPSEDPMGRVGRLPCPMSPVEFGAYVKEKLGAQGVFLADGGRPVSRVAVLGGGGSDDLPDALAAGADAYVTGELKYHQLTDAPEDGVTLVYAGHYETEFPVCGCLRSLVEELIPSVETEIWESNRIRLI